MSLRESMFYEYMKERQGVELLQVPEGFLFYKVNGEECYISELFVTKKYRKTGSCRRLIDKLRQRALAEGCSFMSGNIYLADPGYRTTLLSSLKLGFEVATADQDRILIVLKIRGEDGRTI